MFQLYVSLIFNGYRCLFRVQWMHRLCVPFVFLEEMLLGRCCSVRICRFPPHSPWTFEAFASPISMDFHRLQALICAVTICIRSSHFPCIRAFAYGSFFRVHAPCFILSLPPTIVVDRWDGHFFMRWQSPCVPMLTLVQHMLCMGFSSVSRSCMWCVCV